MTDFEKWEKEYWKDCYRGERRDFISCWNAARKDTLTKAEVLKAIDDLVKKGAYKEDMDWIAFCDEGVIDEFVSRLKRKLKELEG